MTVQTLVRAPLPYGSRVPAVDLRWRARPARSPLAAALVRQAVLLGVVAMLAAPAVTPAAAALRFLFPASAALIAGWLALRGRSAQFVTFCLWLFLLTPFVRRVVDAHAGYAQANVLMLAPYLAAGWSVLQAPRLLFAPGRPGQWPLALMLLACAYGFLLAVARGLYLPATVDLLRWTAPPLLGGYLLVRRDDWREICNELRALAIVALPVISLYGLYQYVALPKWDVIWMLNVKMGSIGPPRPFEVRVFGTMNSPASLAYWLEALILISLGLKTPLRWVSAGLGAAALALTLVRSAWLGLAAGLFFLLARAPQRTRASVVLLGAGLILAAPLALSNARVQHMVSQRIETLTNLGGDVSFTVRSDAYAESLREIVEAPWGQGLGTANVAAKFSNRQRVIDGGPIEVLTSLGVTFGVLYLAMALLLFAAAAVRRAPRTDIDIWAAAQGILVAQTLAFISVTTTVGEIGVLFWLALGLLLAAPGPETQPRAAPTAMDLLRAPQLAGRAPQPALIP